MPPVDVGKVLLEPAILALLAPPAAGPQASFVVSGCGVSYVSGLTFRVSAGIVSINGVQYSFSQTDVTLSTADVSNPRIDLIVADSGSSTIHKVDGTAAAQPARPDYDPLTQFQLTFILVPTGASSIPSVVQTDLYREATETTVTTANGRIVGNSTNNPLAGTKDIEGTACVADDWVKLTNATPLSVSAAERLVLNIRSKAAWANAKNLQLTWFLGSTKVGQIIALASGSFGFSSSVTASYQQIVIPISGFALPANTTADALEIRVKGGGGSIGFYLDNIYLESSTIITQPASSGSVNIYIPGKNAAPHAEDDDFNNDTGLWTNVNWSGQTTVDYNNTVPGALYVLHPNSGSFAIRAKLKAIPAGNWSKVLDMTIPVRRHGGCFAGLCISTTNTNGTGNQSLFGVSTTSGAPYSAVWGYSNFATSNGNQVASSLWGYGRRVLLRWDRSGGLDTIYFGSIDPYTGIIWNGAIAGGPFYGGIAYYGPFYTSDSGESPVALAYNALYHFPTSFPADGARIIRALKY